MILDYAWSKGLVVLAQAPVYPSLGNQKWSECEGYVKDWAKYFAPHPALFGWFLADEIGPNKLAMTLCRNLDRQVSVWIHEAEAEYTHGFIPFHPTMITTSGQPFEGHPDHNPFFGDFPDRDWRASWGRPRDEHVPVEGPPNADGGYAASLIDHFWEYWDPQNPEIEGYIADIIAPNLYPCRNTGDIPKNILSTMTDWTCTARLRHQIYFYDLTGGQKESRNFVVMPFIQMSPEDATVPPSGSVPVMAVQTMLKGSGGGGIFVHDGDVEIVHCTIDNNWSKYTPGSGIFIQKGCSAYILDCIVTNNRGEGIHGNSASNVYTTSSNVWNDIVNYSGTAFAGEGCFSEDPLFVGGKHHDLHLKSSSPCIDRGLEAGVFVDIEGDPRPYGNGYDIGADEWTGK